MDNCAGDRLAIVINYGALARARLLQNSARRRERAAAVYVHKATRKRLISVAQACILLIARSRFLGRTRCLSIGQRNSSVNDAGDTRLR